MHSRLPIGLLWLSLFIGPLCLGSYYGPWRWPLIISASLAGLALACWPLDKPPASGRFSRRLLVSLLVLAGVQGLWMGWNAVHDFTREPTVHSGGVPWSLVPRENVPFPELPGATAGNEAWDRLAAICPALLLIWGVARWVARSPSRLVGICQAIFLTGFVVAAVGLVLRWLHVEDVYEVPDGITYGNFSLYFATFRSPAIASVYLNIAMALGLSLSLRQICSALKKGRGMAKAVFYLLGVVVIFNGVMAAGSKAGMAMAGATIGLWLLMNGHVLWAVIRSSASLFPKAGPIERGAIASALLLTVVLTGLSWAETTVLRWQKAMDTDYGTMAVRAQVNWSMGNMIKAPDWGALGFGPGSFYPLLPYYSHGTQLKGLFYYAHNDHLQTLVEWGWWGFSVLALLIGGACAILLWNSLSLQSGRSLGRRGKVMQRGVFIAIFVCLLHASVDFPFQIESIAITIAVLVGIGWGSAVHLRNR